MNHGFIPEPRKPEDFVLGADRSLVAKFGATPLVPDGDWTTYLYDLVYSHQAPVFETNACTVHGLLNACELLANRVFGRTLDLSDRFVSALAGIDPQRGATPRTAAEWFRKNWSVNEADWPTNIARSVEEFYAPPPSKLKTLALAQGAEYAFGWEYVNISKPTIKEALKYSPVCISVYLLKDENGLFYKPAGERDGHWLTCLKIKDNGNYIVLDSYPDEHGSFIKEIRADFTPEMAMGYYISKQITSDSWFAKFLQQILVLLGLAAETPPPTLPSPPEPQPEVEPAAPPRFLWATPAEAKVSVRAICKEEGLSAEQTNTLVATVAAESGFKNTAVNYNKRDGKTVSTDWGICQINDYWHCGPGKSFPSVQYVKDNPEQVVRWMCRQWKAGNRHLWIAYKNGLYKQYL